MSALTVLVLLPAALDAQPIFLGGELQINTTTSGSQVRPSIAAADDIGFVVVWEQSAGVSSQVFGRRFDQSGSPQGAQFAVNDAAAGAGFEQFPDVAMARAGGPASGARFVVVWQRYGDGDSTGIFGRAFAGTGEALGPELQVNVQATSAQHSPAVAMSAAGDFVVVWRGEGQNGYNGAIFGQLFDAFAQPQSSEFQVNTYTEYDPVAPDVAMEDDGDFTVVWSYPDEAYLRGIFAKQFDSKGNPLGSEFRVNTDLPHIPELPAVASDDDGDFVVVWQTYYSQLLIPPGGPPPVFVLFFVVLGRRFDSSGGPVATEFSVNTLLTLSQSSPDVALADDGSFLVAWHGEEPGEVSTDVRGRVFAADVEPQGEFQINSFDDDAQTRPAVASGGNGFVVVWESASQDGDQVGIFGQRLSGTPAPTPTPSATASPTATATRTPTATATATPTATASPTPSATSTPGGVVLDVDGDSEVEALTDGLLALRWMFGFSGPTLTSGALDLVHCTRCAAPAIESYLTSTAAQLDIDGDAQLEALTDGLLVLRWLFGFTGTTLTTGAVDLANCARCTAGPIETHLDGLDG